MANETRFDEKAACDRCGRFGAHVFDGHTLCTDCYECRGSCCPEFEEEDEEAVHRPTCRADAASGA